MKWIIYLSSSLYLFAVQSALAAVPVTMSGPTPAIAGSYNTGDSNTFTYTITNNVPNKSFPITVNGISGPVSRIAVAGDCGSSLPRGPSTCNIGILIAPTSGNGGQSFNQNLSINYQGRTPLVKNIALTVQASAFLPLLTAVGQDFTGSAPPLVVVSTNGGNTWEVKPVTGLPPAGFFKVSSCTGSGLTALCTAAGQAFGGGTSNVLAIGTNGGNTWAVKSVPGLPASTIFNTTSCTGSGSTAICTAAGYVSAGSVPILAVSTDGGNTWAVKSVTGLPAAGVFSATSCTGSGSTAICTAAGQDYTGLEPPLLAVSTDGGNTWAVKPVTGLPANGELFGTSCTGNGSTAVCTAVGRDDTGSLPPLLVVSTDGGNTWAVKPVTGLPINGNFSAASCTGSGSTAICTAAGQDYTGIQPPLLAVSTDGGNTWAVKSVTGLPTAGTFVGASCTGSESTAICTAAGYESIGVTPIVAVSADGGNTWAIKSVIGLPVSGNYNATRCTGNGSTAICTAVGQDITNTSALLAVSTDGGNTWAVKSVTGLPSSSIFYGAGATGGSL